MFGLIVWTSLILLEQNVVYNAQEFMKCFEMTTKRCYGFLKNVERFEAEFMTTTFVNLSYKV
jgi:hypothetical protein